MDNSDKGLYSSSAAATRPSVNLKFSTTGRTDENAQNCDKMVPKLHNPLNKPPPIKHFIMSPTVSAASKASSAARKKVLVERNEQNTCASDSSFSNYDPLTNYLSPRPKFLRYKPNRHSKIFLGDEKEIGKENVWSGEEEEEEVRSSQEGVVDQKEEKINKPDGDHQEDDADEESEEFEEEENYSVLKKVLKFLLVIGILFLSTDYICSMNSPSPSLTPQASGHLNDGYHQIQNQTSEVIHFLEGGRLLSLVRTEGIEFTSSIGFDDEAKAEGNSNGLVESADELGEVVDMEKTVGFSLKQIAESEEVLDFVQSKGIELSETTEMSDNVQVEVEDKAEKVEKEVVEIKIDERVEEGLTQNADGISKGEVDLVKELLLVLLTAALSLLGFYFWKKKTLFSVEKPLSEPILEEKTTSICPVGLPILEEEHIEKIEKIEHFLNSSSLLGSKEEEPCQIRAPTVELLGEFVVGGEVSSSVKSRGMQSKLMEIEVSSSSAFQQKGMGSKACVFSSPVKPSASDFSTMNSPSYGSFTAEKKISKKEEGKEGGVKAAAATTLRRSSRLHGRAVISP